MAKVKKDNMMRKKVVSPKAKKQALKEVPSKIPVKKPPKTAAKTAEMVLKKKKVAPKKVQLEELKPISSLVKKATPPKPTIKGIRKAVPAVKKEAPPIKPAAQPVKTETVEIKKTVPTVIEKTPEIKVKPSFVPPRVQEIKKETLVPLAPALPIKEAAAAIPQVVAPALKEIELTLPITVKDLAVKMREKPSVLIKTFLDMKMMVGINQALDDKLCSLICQKFGYSIKEAPGAEEIVLRKHQEQDVPSALRPRPPIVTFMGHVDHGKTSLLDAIRKSKVTESEFGGITQHIGAYRVVLKTGEITFLDTPGHEAFTAMRARGASITDIVVLVVAADDGVMPQTQEAIDHARAAEVTIIVAVNKIDKPQANVERVKKQLSAVNITPEDWGGKNVFVSVSAKTGEGIDELLEMILLEAQMLELKANPARIAKGVVIESKMSKGRGPVSTLLIQNGTLYLNNNIVAGSFYGKAKAMFNDHGQPVTEAGPSCPVEVFGISGLPPAGEQFFVIEDEKTAKELVLSRQEQDKERQLKTIKRISLQDLHAQIQEGKIKELKIILKADVQGSLEAIKDTLNKLNVSEIS